MRREEIEIEAREVDGHEDIRPFGLGRRNEASIHRVHLGKDAHDLGEPSHRQSGEVADQPGTGRLHPLTTEPEDRGGRFASAEFSDERGGVEIAGRLAAGDHDVHASECSVLGSVQVRCWVLGSGSGFRFETRGSGFRDGTVNREPNLNTNRE